MKKKCFMAMMGIVVMMALVVVLAVESKTSADACSWFKKVDVNLYLGNDNADGFNTEVVRTKLTAKKLIKALQKKGAVAKGVKVRAFVDNDQELVLNLSQAFADDVSSAGTSGEYIKVGSVVNTFLDAYDAETILITVEGKAWESGHVVYDAPMPMFSVSNEQPQEPEVEPQEPSVEPEQPEEEPQEPEQQGVSAKIYVGNDNADGFNVKEVQIEEVTPENLIKALQAEGAVAQGVKVNSFRQIDTNLILDLSEEFKNDVCNSGTAGEYIKIGCIVNTFLDAYNYSEILITVNGDPWETGHNMYDFAFTKFN
jgi:spore germination protein GerM